MKHFFRALFLLAFCAGCTPITPNIAPSSEDAQAKTQIVGPHRSHLYVYRRAAFIAPGPGLLPIIVDTQIVAQIAYGTYASLDLGAGDHVASTIVPTSVREFDFYLMPGEVCFLEAKIKGGVYYYERQPESVGRAAIHDLKLVRTRFRE